MSRGHVAVLLACLCLCGLAGCGTPRWVSHPPSGDTHIFAVGRWPKTQYANQRRLAGDEARAELARTIHVSVTEQMTLLQSKYGSRTTDRMRRVLSNSTAADLQGVEILKYWTDRSGKLGARDTMYALARISRSDAAAALRRSAARQLQAEDDGALDEVLQQVGQPSAP